MEENASIWNKDLFKHKILQVCLVMTRLSSPFELGDRDSFEFDIAKRCYRTKALQYQMDLLYGNVQSNWNLYLSSWSSLLILVKEKGSFEIRWKFWLSCNFSAMSNKGGTEMSCVGMFNHPWKNQLTHLRKAIQSLFCLSLSALKLPKCTLTWK